MNKLQVLNAALRKCGVEQVVSEDEDFSPLKLAISAYSFVLNTVLREFAWSFATKYADMAMLTDIPAFGYEAAFQIPSDCVLIIDIRAGNDLSDKEAPYARSMDKIFANASTLHIRYISNNVPVEKWSIDFCDVFATKLACEIALVATQIQGLTQVLLQAYEYALDKARVNDLRENNDIKIDETRACSLLSSRNY